MPTAFRPPAGAYHGHLGHLPLTFHLAWENDDRPRLTLDSPNQGAYGIECDEVHIEARALRFTVPSINASWSGTLAPDDVTLSGTWVQGLAQPLELVRDTFVPAAVPSPIDGIWLGTLSVREHSLRLQLIVRTDQAGRLSATLDSLDQHATGVQCAEIVFADGRLDFEVPSIHGRWSGALSADARSLTGTWKQRQEHALAFERQTQVTRVQPPPPPRMLPALPPVPVAEIGAALARDFETVLTTGWLAPGQPGAVVVGVVENGTRTIIPFGAAGADAIFEIGSITKPFTGLVLAQMVVQGQVQLDEPVARLLPPGVIGRASPNEITLLDLSTHHSGLPRLPANLRPADPDNPYADYDEEKLYRFLSEHGTRKPDNPPFGYSNLGVGLLGHALAVRAGMPFPALLKEQITLPLGLRDTTIALTPEQRRRFAQGHDAHGKPTSAWDVNVLTGAGGLRSTVADMLTWLAAFLAPRSIRPAPGTAGGTLGQALDEAQQPRVEFADTSAVCLGWFFHPQGRTYWHGGGTGGFTSFAAFSREKNRAIVVMTNRQGGNAGAPAEIIGRYVTQRLDGQAAIWPGHAFPEETERDR